MLSFGFDDLKRLTLGKIKESRIAAFLQETKGLNSSFNYD